MSKRELGVIFDRLVAEAMKDGRTPFRKLVSLAGLDPKHDFIGASLRGLDLHDEDLRGFNFSKADLSGTDFRRANIVGVNFDGALLSETVGLQALQYAEQQLVREGTTNQYITALDEHPGLSQSFASDVVRGLSRFPKKLLPKYFYDAKGSELFEQITVLPEYYPTRTELSILRDHGREIAAITPNGAALIEFGAGATTKIRLLLERCNLRTYVPVDISGVFLDEQVRSLRKDFPNLDIYPVATDFTEPFDLPAAAADLPKVGFFPGSTLGSFEPAEASAILRNAQALLGTDARMIIGVDLEKDERTLYDAYNDRAGVTARFNLNVLERINRELGGNFDLASFAHRSIYNRERHRIEMHLISRKAQSVRVLGQKFSFRPGESIHTANSYKYSLERFAALARASGWQVTESWTDKAAMFSVHALVTKD